MRESKQPGGLVWFAAREPGQAHTRRAIQRIRNRERHGARGKERGPDGGHEPRILEIVIGHEKGTHRHCQKSEISGGGGMRSRISAGRKPPGTERNLLTSCRRANKGGRERDEMWTQPTILAKRDSKEREERNREE